MLRLGLLWWGSECGRTLLSTRTPSLSLPSALLLLLLRGTPRAAVQVAGRDQAQRALRRPDGGEALESWADYYAVRGLPLSSPAGTPAHFPAVLLCRAPCLRAEDAQGVHIVDKAPCKSSCGACRYRHVYGPLQVSYLRVCFERACQAGGRTESRLSCTSLRGFQPPALACGEVR